MICLYDKNESLDSSSTGIDDVGFANVFSGGKAFDFATPVSGIVEIAAGSVGCRREDEFLVKIAEMGDCGVVGVVFCLMAAVSVGAAALATGFFGSDAMLGGVDLFCVVATGGVFGIAPVVLVGLGLGGFDAKRDRMDDTAEEVVEWGVFATEAVVTCFSSTGFVIASDLTAGSAGAGLVVLLSFSATLAEEG